MKQKEKISIALLGKAFTVLLIILICAISFGGLYIVNKNKTSNIVPEYQLGMDLYGSRNIVIKVSDDSNDSDNLEETTSTQEDSENSDNEEKNDKTSEISNIEESQTQDGEETNNETTESDKNSEETTTPSVEDFKKTEKIIEQRLEYMGVKDYIIRLNEEDGTISLEVPEDSSTDYIAQYCITPGVFEITDKDTSEQLMNNSDIKEAKVGYYTESSGTSVYLTIKFNKEGSQKLNEISKEYVKSQDSDGNDTSKKVEMKLDDETILSSYFEEEMTDGMIQISIGTSTDASTIKTYLQQASNIAVFLNTEPMPVKYEMETNRFVYSNTKLDNEFIIPAICGIIAFVAGIYMIIKYKKLGLLGLISILGFVAILLLAIRVGNVELTISGIATIALIEMFEIIVVTRMQQAYKNGIEDNKVKKNMIDLLKKCILIFIPLVVIAITFAFSAYAMLTGIGMILFWAIFIMALYNIFVLGMIIFNPMNKE